MRLGSSGGDQKRIAKQAADWHMRMLEPASEAEVEAFEAWLRNDPAHARAYADFESMSAAATRLPFRLANNPEIARRPTPLRPAFGLAIAAVLLLTGGFWLTAQISQPAHAAISNPGPAVRGVRLTDGTTVILDSGAELLVMKGDARAVSLRKGRVRFEVANAGKLFSVSAAAARITASDSIFDVALADDQLSVVVIRGEVGLAVPVGDRSKIEPLSLMAGRAVNLRDDRLSESRIEPAAARWPAGRLAFENQRIAAVAALANRWGSPPITFENEDVASLRVTGVLDIRDTRALARKLAVSLDLRAEESAEAILLRR